MSNSVRFAYPKEVHCHMDVAHNVMWALYGYYSQGKFSFECEEQAARQIARYPQYRLSDIVDALVIYKVPNDVINNVIREYNYIK